MTQLLPVGGVPRRRSYFLRMADQLPSTRRGVSALATVLTALSVFAILTASVGQLALERLRGTSRSNIQLRAKYATVYGLERILAYLDGNITYDDANNEMVLTPIDVADFEANHTNVSLQTDTETRYSARLYDNLQGTSSYTAPDGTVVAPGQVYIQMVGQVGENVARVNTRHSGVMGHIGIQEHNHAAMCNSNISLNNTKVDMYASSFMNNNTGPLSYDQTKNFENPSGTKFFPDKAPVATNGRVQAVRLLNNSVVNGSVYIGAGGTPASAIVPFPPPAGAITNTTGTLANTVFLTKYKPPVSPYDVPDGNVTLAADTTYDAMDQGPNPPPSQAHDAVTVDSGQTLTLRARFRGSNSFYFKDALVLKSGSRLNLQLYDDGPWTPWGSGIDIHPSLQIAGYSTTPGHAQMCRIKVYIGRLFRAEEGVKINSNVGAVGTDFQSYTWPFSLNLFGVGEGGPQSKTTFEFLGTDILDPAKRVEAYALISGSKSDIVMEETEFYGAIKANSLSATNSNIHFDAAVTKPNVRRSTWGRVSWTLQGVSDYAGESLLIDLTGVVGAAAVAVPAGGLGAATSTPGGVATGAAVASPAVTAAPAVVSTGAAIPAGNAATGPATGPGPGTTPGTTPATTPASPGTTPATTPATPGTTPATTPAYTPAT